MRSYDDFDDDYGSTASKGGQRNAPRRQTQKQGNSNQDPGGQQHSPSNSSNSTHTRTAPIFVRDDSISPAGTVQGVNRKAPYTNSVQTSPQPGGYSILSPVNAQQTGNCAVDARSRPIQADSVHQPGSVFSRLSSRPPTAGPSPAATPSPHGPSPSPPRPTPSPQQGPSPFGAVGNLLSKAVAAATADAQQHLNSISKASQGHQLSPSASTQRVPAGGSSPHGNTADASVASSVRDSSFNSLRRAGSNTSSVVEIASSKPSQAFQAPKVPQAPVTHVETNNRWALMLEAGAQNMESVLGPLAAAMLGQMSAAASADSGATSRDALAAAAARASWDAQGVLELMMQGPLSTKMTLAQGNLLSAAATALALLLPADATHAKTAASAVLAPDTNLGIQASTSDTEATAAVVTGKKSVTPEEAVAGQQAFLDVLKDMQHSVQHSPLIRDTTCAAFTHFLDNTLLPELDSAVLYGEMLLADAQEAVAAALSG